MLSTILKVGAAVTTTLTVAAVAKKVYDRRAAAKAWDDTVTKMTTTHQHLPDEGVTISFNYGADKLETPIFHRLDTGWVFTGNVVSTLHPDTPTHRGTVTIMCPNTQLRRDQLLDKITSCLQFTWVMALEPASQTAFLAD